ncbi:N-acetylmannosamine kinase [Mesorhizobium amorphae]|uniref:N-acetylmannosamine kinase n=1 Tax=Mesorhizobium amorphae CCNWGS0123 TaxID=1082933 RepID=G6YIM8_9HYPH|nr:N-acetylmannosamine kinase [Mesorhizobium amorphae]ANT52991.1 sugar kinase [Mesorhizobium amorphae CCNWGS0123]EHH05910.1 N-acetylmannosamine kinase [Mesorhizobium amorphae CCNWGS0123]GLR40863.1 N-acetylmannosamine kinase [Mesorhizobium amorphae]
MTAASNLPVLAIDIGGSKIAIAEVSGGSVANRRQAPTPRTGRGDDLIAAIAELAPDGGFGAVAVATTGIVRDGALTALNPQTLPIEDGYPLASAIERAFGTPPLVVNDAQAAAWAEFTLGAGKGVRNFAFFTVSTGIGCGLVVDGRLESGATGLAGHVGHTRSGPGGILCGCGRHGCLETVASGTALARLGSERLGRKVAAPDVFSAATGGNSVATKIIASAVDALVNGFADLTASVDVDCFAIGGGVGLAPGFIEALRVRSLDLPRIFQRPIVAAQAGADAGLLGAAMLARLRR